MKKKIATIVVAILCIAFSFAIGIASGQEESDQEAGYLEQRIRERAAEWEELNRRALTLSKELEEVRAKMEHLHSLNGMARLQIELLRKPMRMPAPYGDPYRITVTSYNPENGQTDASPCIGAGLTNVCELQKSGVRVLALSQDLVGRADSKPFRYGDYVELSSESPACSGLFRVEDTMHERFTMRGDIFSLNRSENIGRCEAVMRKVE